MGAAEAKIVQLNLKINGEGAFNTLKDLNEHVATLRQKMNRVSKDDPSYQQAAQKLRECIEKQKVWREEIYGTQKVTKSFFDDFKANMASIAGGVTIGTLLANGISSAIGSVREFIGSSEAAFKEAEQNQAQLAAAIQSTGAAAGRTQEQLNDLSNELMNQTGIDDDLISKAEALLLTFTNISGEIYDQTLPLILDISKALGQDLQTSSIQVGKALNDPVNGLTALKRVGVSFSEEQKNIIQRLQETGDIAGAQKLILAELGKEFGGVAQALSNTNSGQLERFNTRMENIKESLGGMMTAMKVASLGALEPFVHWLEKATSTDLPAKLRDEQTELNGLVRAISMTNNNQAVRNQLIAELQAKYPDFLGKIKAEDVSNELLARRLEAVNNQYREKIFIAVNEEKIKAIQEKRNQAIKEEAQARMEVAKASKLSAEALAKLNDQEVEALAKKQREAAIYADMQRGGAIYSAGTSNTSNREAKNLELILNGRKRIAESIKEEGDLMAANAIYSNRAKDMRLKAIDEEIAKLNSLKTAQSSTEIERLKGERNQLLGIIPKPNTGSGDDNDEEKAQKKAKTEAKKALDEFEKFGEEYKKLRADRLLDSLSKNEKEIQQEKNKYQALIDEREKYLKKINLTKEERTGVSTQITSLKADEKTAVATIALRQEKDMLKEVADLRENLEVTKQNQTEKEIALINKKYARLKEDAAGNATIIKLLETNQATDLANVKIREEKRFQDAKKNIEADILADGLSKDEQELAAINKKYDDKLEALKESFSQEQQATEEFHTLMAEIEAGRKKELTDKEGKNETEDKAEKAKKAKDFACNTAQETSNAVFSIMAANRQAESQEHIASINKQREAELSNKSLTEEQKKAINAKYDKQIADEKLRAWQADKSASLTQAIINGALAVVKALPNVPLSIAAGVAAAAQIAVITAQKPPKFAQGGQLPEGPSHAAGGISLINPSGRKVGEIEGGEPILSRETYANNKQLIDTLLYSSQRLKGASISVNTADIVRADRMFRNGGIAPSSTNITNHTVNNSTADLSALIAELRELQSAVREEKKRPIDFNYRVFEEHRDKIDGIRAGVEA